jgi:hypothetical protein
MNAQISCGWHRGKEASRTEFPLISSRKLVPRALQVPNERVRRSCQKNQVQVGEVIANKFKFNVFRKEL